MARLTLAARQVLDSLDSDLTLVAPAMATRLSGQRAWLRTFYAQKPGGRPVADLVDVLSFQLYPPGDAQPEAQLDQLAGVRESLKINGVDKDKPIWNTEVNYGAEGGAPAVPISDEQQVSYVGRTYVLNATHDVERVYWYGWDIRDIINTVMIGPDGAVTPAGSAMTQVKDWLLGTVPKGCQTAPDDTWTCTFDAPGGETRTVYWNPKRTVDVPLASDSSAVERLGVAEKSGDDAVSKLRVGATPVMVIS
jgi:hypothetical protein